MLNTAPPARYDLSWKAVLTHEFRPFMELFFPDLAVQIDWSQRPRSRDKELVGIGFGDASNSVVADKLIEVCFLDVDVRRVLIHVEVQAQRDVSLAWRVFDYNYRIFKENGLQVISLVLLADDDPNWCPSEVYNRPPGTVMGISFSIAKLLDYAGDGDALAASENPIAWITLAHLCTQRAHHDPDLLYAAKWRLTKLLYDHKWSKPRIIVLFKAINWMMTLPEPYHERYWQAVRQLEKERNMELVTPLEQWFIDTGWQKGLKKGRQEGLKQGREQGLEKGLEKGLERGRKEGRKEGAVALLERQLVRRFGPLTKTTQNKLARASVEQLGAWSDALLEAQSLKQVFE